MDSNMKSASKSEAAISEDFSDSDGELNFDDLKDIADDNEGENNVIVFNCESYAEPKNSSEETEGESSPSCEDPVTSDCEVPTVLVRKDSPVDGELVKCAVISSTSDKKENSKTVKKKNQQTKKKNFEGASVETNLVSNNNSTGTSKAIESESLVKKSNVFKPKPDESEISFYNDSKKKPKLDESEISFNNNSKKKPKLDESESKIKETKFSLPVHQLKVILERIDLSRYRIGNSDRFSSRPICNSTQKSISTPANDKNHSSQLEVPHQKDIKKAYLIKTTKSSVKGEEKSLPPIKIKPLKVKNTPKETNCLKDPFKIKLVKQRVKIKKRPAVEEVPVFHTKPLNSSTIITNNFIDQSARALPPSSLNLDVFDKEKTTKSVKRRRISDTNISSPSVKLKSFPEDSAANSERLTPVTKLVNGIVGDVVVDRPLKIDPKVRSDSKSKEVGKVIISNAVELKSSTLREIEDDSGVTEQLGKPEKLSFNKLEIHGLKSASKKLISKKVENKADNCKAGVSETGEGKLEVDLETRFDFVTEASEFLVKDLCDDYKIDLDDVFKILDDDPIEDDEEVIKQLLNQLVVKVDRLAVNSERNLATSDKSLSINGAEICAGKLLEEVVPEPVASSKSILAKDAQKVVPSSSFNIIGENSAIIDEKVATKTCDSSIKTTILVPSAKCEQTRSSKWYHPVANLTKSERRLRKIKRGHGTSAEFKKKMKFLLKRNYQQNLIEIVQLRKLSEAKILELSRGKFTSNLSKLQTQFPRNAPHFKRPKESSAALVDSTFSHRKSSKIVNNSEKYREDKSHIGAMKKADSALAKRLSNLPRIPKKVSASNSDLNARNPKKVSVSNSDLNAPKISNSVIEKVGQKVVESKCESPLSNLKSSIAMESKSNDSIRRKPVEEVLLKVVTSKNPRNSLDDCNRLVKYTSSSVKTGSGWDELELDELFKIGEKHLTNQKHNTMNAASKLSRINHLVMNNSASSVSKPYNPFCGIIDLPTSNEAKIVSIKPSTDKPMDDNPTNNELLPTANCPDYLSVDPQVSDDKISVATQFDDSSISSVEDVSVCSRNTALIVSRSNYWIEKYEASVLKDTSYFYRYELLESLASDGTVEDVWSQQCEAETKIYDDSNKRHFFDQELSKMNLDELEKKMNLSVLADNFKKCLMVFEHIMKKLVLEMPMLTIEKLFVIAKKCINCSQEDAILFLEIVGNCISPKKNFFEKVKTLTMLCNWLNAVNGLAKDSHWTAIGRQVGFSKLVSLFNQILAEGINAKHGSIIGVYRAGSRLNLPMDASVIRGLVSWFVSSNILSACQDVYNLGCQLGVYNCLKVRRWPMVILVRSYYTVEEIKIILLEFLIKLDKILSTKFFFDLGINLNEDLSLYIRFEELKYDDFSVVGINILSSMTSSLDDVYERFKMVLSSMGESFLDNVKVDQKRTILRLEKPLLEKLIKYVKVHAQSMKPFIDHDKPKSFNALAYQESTANSIFYQYDENPFI